MRSKIQKKFKKQKERERKAHAKVVREREKLRAKAKEEREDQRRHRRLQRLQKDLDRFDDFFPAEILDQLPEDTVSQLENNVKVLKALEEEHNQEQESRAALNKELESRGLFTLEDKLQFSLEKSAKETAEVTVTKVSVENSEQS